MSKNWKIAPLIPEEIKKKFPEINPVILQLLYNRGIDSQEKVDEFTNPDYEQDLHDPFLFKDMAKAVERIFQAIDKGEKIMVHGDYDADGVCSSVVMMSILIRLVELFGQKEKVGELLDIYIPHREKEGYGLKPETVELFIKQKIDLVITVDCGVANKDEINLCQQNNIDVIITDHHQEPLELPKPYALINPSLKKEKYPFKELAGVGVAFKVVQALIKEAAKRKPEENWEGFTKWLLDLVALGTVADVCPLIGENRTLVKYGLVVLNKTPRLGLRALFNRAGIEGNNNISNGLRDSLPQRGLNTYSIAFQIAPRLNAAGRMDHANTAYALLMTTKQKEAEELADSIQKSNSDRQALTDKILIEAEEQINKQLKDEKLLIIYGQGWPTGVLGLVAGKLTDKYYRPVIIASLFEGQVVGSGRSVEEFNIIAALQKLDKYFKNYGGHPAACGFTLKNNDDFIKFQKELQMLANQELKNIELKPILEVEAEIDLEEITWGLYDELEKLEPFGEANPKPKFLVPDLEIDSAEPVGRDGSHLKILVKQKNGMLRKLIGFGLANNEIQLPRGGIVDMVVEVGINEWNGNRELQLKIIDLKIK